MLRQPCTACEERRKKIEARARELASRAKTIFVTRSGGRNASKAQSSSPVKEPR